MIFSMISGWSRRSPHADSAKLLFNPVVLAQTTGAGLLKAADHFGQRLSEHARWSPSRRLKARGLDPSLHRTHAPDEIKFLSSQSPAQGTGSTRVAKNMERIPLLYAPGGWRRACLRGDYVSNQCPLLWRTVDPLDLPAARQPWLGSSQ